MSENIIIGGQNNSISTGSYINCSISAGQNNVISTHNYNILGGSFNFIGNGGCNIGCTCLKCNGALGTYAPIVGDQNNSISSSYGSHSAIVGGQYNTIFASYSVIGGGCDNSCCCLKCCSSFRRCSRIRKICNSDISDIHNDNYCKFYYNCFHSNLQNKVQSINVRIWKRVLKEDCNFGLELGYDGLIISRIVDYVID